MKDLIKILSICFAIFFGNNNCTAQNYVLDLDGEDDYVEITSYVNMSPTTTVSVEAWVKGQGIPSTRFIYDRIESNDGYGIFVRPTGLAAFEVNGGQAQAFSSTNVLDGYWHHIAGTYDANVGKLYVYIDGVMESSVNYSLPITYSPEPRNTIGGPGGGSTVFEPFEGEIDEVRVWDLVRTQQQIQDNMCKLHYTSYNSGLIAYWQLDEGSGTIANDLSQNGNNGTILYGATWIAEDYCSLVGLEEAAIQEFKIYPNPMSGHVTIELEGEDYQAYTIKVFNTMGQLMEEIEVNGSNKTSIKSDNLNSGLYFVHIIANNKVIGREKLIVE